MLWYALPGCFQAIRAGGKGDRGQRMVPRLLIAEMQKRRPRMIYVTHHHSSSIIHNHSGRYKEKKGK